MEVSAITHLLSKSRYQRPEEKAHRGPDPARLAPVRTAEPCRVPGGIPLSGPSGQTVQFAIFMNLYVSASSSTLQGPDLNAQNSALGVGILGADISFTITDIVLLLASIQNQPTQSASTAL